MGYLLFWFEHIVTTLLLVALLAACISHVRSRGRRIAAAIILAVILGAGYVTLVVFTGIARFQVNLATNYFTSTLLWLLVYAIGAAVLIRWSLRDGVEGAGAPGAPTAPGVPAGRAWSRPGLLLAFAVAAMLQGMTLWNLDLAARAKLTAMKTEAGAMALSVAPARVPDRSNAALIYEQAFEHIDPQDKRSPHITDLIAKPQEPVKPGDAEVSAFLNRHATALRLLREAAALPDCYFEHDYGRPSISMLLPEYDKLRAASQLLQLSARYHAAEGRLKFALGDISGMLRIADHAGSQPLLISLLVAVRTEATAADTLAAILARARPDADDLSALVIDERLSFLRMFRRGLLMEEALGLSTFAMFADPSDPMANLRLVSGMSEEKGASLPMLELPFRVFMLPSDAEGYRRLMADCRAAADQPWPKARDRMKAVYDGFIRVRPGILCSLLLPALSRVMHTAHEAEARHRLLLAAKAAALLRAEGALPDDAAALAAKLGGALPLDPYSGRPLCVAYEGGDVVLYSVGPDGVDDGGSPLDPEGKKGDVAFRLPRR